MLAKPLRPSKRSSKREVTLNVSGHNAPMPCGSWRKKPDPSICCLQATHFRPKDIQSEGIEKNSMQMEGEKKAGIQLLSDKVDIKTKTRARDKGIP